jgi:hypothetical protein
MVNRRRRKLPHKKAMFAEFVVRVMKTASTFMKGGGS